METNKLGGNIVFYLESIVTNGEIKLETKKRCIPLELKDKFLLEFDTDLKNNSITTIKIDKFLLDNE